MTEPVFCVTCRHLESVADNKKAERQRPRLCLRPGRMIRDMVTGTLMANSAQQVAARDERKGFDPGACGPGAKFFEGR